MTDGKLLRDRRQWGGGSLYQRSSDGRWIGVFRHGTKKTYVTSLDREKVAARLDALAEEWPRGAREEDAFWAKVEKSDGCWTWRGAITTTGYGQMRFDGRLRQAHRISFQVHGGIVPDGMELDHLCSNRRCVNPDHLEPVTHRENVQRAFRGAGCATRTRTLSRAMAPKAIVSAIPPTRPGR